MKAKPKMSIIGNYGKNVKQWMPLDNKWRRLHTLKLATEVQRSRSLYQGSNGRELWGEDTAR
jgi:hypothetical protein